MEVTGRGKGKYGMWPAAVMGVLLAVTLVAAVVAAAPLPEAEEATAPDSIIYVDWEAVGANDGSSWDDAFADLQDGLAAAQASDAIWVAAGTYYPSVEVGGSGDRYKTFQMKNEVGIYGGFDPSVGDVGWEDRDWVANETILSGDIGVPGSSGDNSYHVFYHPEGMLLDASAILDGLIIRDGNADGLDDHARGGGMFNHLSSPTLANCTFASNEARGIVGYGGGMYNDTSSPTLTNCRFEWNLAIGSFGEGYGGGMYNANSSPSLTDCVFQWNWAGDDFYDEYSGGGGMYNDASSPSLTNCTFDHNVAVEGGGMHNADSSPILVNCTFLDNRAGDSAWELWGHGGGMYNEASSPTLIGCIFDSNVSSDTGGGMHNNASSPTLTDCTFRDNGVGGWMVGDGGGMYNYDSSPVLANCVFEGNQAEMYGGGMFNRQSAPTLTNCSFSHNEAYADGSGMYNYDSSPTLTNSILWADSPDEISGDPADVTYSDIQGGYAGEGNIDAEPLFVDPGNGDFHLGAGSPCIDSGTNDAPNLSDFDFEGDPRVIDGDGDGTATADMGVDEFLVPITGLEAANDSPTALGGATTLTATVTAGSNVTNTWSFGDAETGGGPVVAHIYPATGSYTAVVTASNSVSWQSASTLVTVEEAVAGLSAMNDSPTPLGSATTLTATVTAGGNVTYTWSFGDTATGSGPVVAHLYPATGSYPAVVTASNSVSWQSANTLVTVEEAIAGLGALNDSPTALGTATTLTATVTAGGNVTYTWSFGDAATGSGPVVAHVYPATGSYTAVVTARNSVGQQAASTVVTIYEPATYIYLPLVVRGW